MSVFRNAVFTWNNYPDDVDDLLTQLPEHTYIVYGYEVGDSGTPHLQGYVEFAKQVRFPSLKKRFPKVHWEKRKGTAEQAAMYCKKEAKRIVEEGTMSRQGTRTDIDQVRQQLQGEEPTMRAVTLTATSCQSVRFAEIFLKYHEPKRNFKPVVTWLYGGPGVGKTQRCHDDAAAKGFGDDIHMQLDTAKWWEDYDRHQVVIMDDVRSTFCPYVRMLNILDRYACRVECKGGSRQMLAKHIYVTSDVHPELVWGNSEDKGQLLRRIDNIEQILSFTESKVIKGNGIPLYQKEAIVEEATEDAWNVDESDFSCEEVCSTSTSET